MQQVTHRESRTTLWSVALLLVVQQGCTTEGPGLLPIGMVDLRIAESAGQLTVSAQTQHDYGCLGFTISHTDYARPAPLGMELRMDLLGVRSPGGTCAAAVAPATGTATYRLPPIGKHSLRVTINNTTALATLEVTADSLLVTSGESPWTTWPQPRVARP